MRKGVGKRVATGCLCQCTRAVWSTFAIFTGLLKPHNRLMGLDLPDEDSE